MQYCLVAPDAQGDGGARRAADEEHHFLGTKSVHIYIVDLEKLVAKYIP